MISDIRKKSVSSFDSSLINSLIEDLSLERKNVFLTTVLRRVLPYLPSQTLFIAPAYFMGVWSFSGISNSF